MPTNTPGQCGRAQRQAACRAVVVTALGCARGEATRLIGTGTMIGTIPVGQHPDGVAVDPTTHTAYVTNQYDNTVSVVTSS